jgi:hypothetical protein
MRALALGACMATAVLSMVLEAPAQTPLNPLPPSSPSLFRPPPVPGGTGFYSRTYRAPGFSSVPTPPNYNSVSFYGRSYRPSGFSPVPPNTPVTTIYATEYRLLGLPPQTAVQIVRSTPTGPSVAVPEGFSLAIPEGFMASSDMGSYSGLSYFAPGSFVPSGY